MAGNGNEAIGILFDVQGGGSVSGESGKRINKQLSEIVKTINASDTVKLKFQIDSKHFQQEIDELKKQLKNINLDDAGGKSGKGSKAQTKIFQEASKEVDNYYKKLTLLEKELTRTNTLQKGKDGTFSLITEDKNGNKLEPSGYTKELVQQYEQAKASYENYQKTLASGKLKDEERIALQQRESALLADLNLKRENFARTAEISWGQLSAKVNDYVDRVQNAAERDPQAKKMLEDLRAAANDASPDAYKGYDALKQKLIEVQEYINKNSLATETWFQRLKKTFGTRIRSLLSGLVIGKVTMYFREIYQDVVNIDSAMTQLQIVAGANDRQMSMFFSNATKQAKELGASITDVLKSVETFSRLGYSLADSTQLSRFSTILSNIAGVAQEEATTGVTSIIKGFGLDVSDIEHVADVLMDVGKKYAVSSSELITAYELSGAALAATGTSFEKSAGLIAAGNAAVQNASITGTALKTVSARIRGATTELSELGEEGVENFSKYAEEIKQITGFDILVEGTTDTYKDLYDIFTGLAANWDSLSDTARARGSEILGGTRQLQVVSSIIKNISDATGAYETALNSSGSALKANEVFMDSAQGRINALKASLQELSTKILSSNTVKDITNLLSGAVTVLGTIFKYVGGLNGALTIFAGILATIKSKKIYDFFSTFGKRIDKLKASFYGASAGANALNISLAAITAVISIAIIAFNAYKTAKENAIADAIEASQKAQEEAKSHKENAESIKELTESYKELKEAYDANPNQENLNAVRGLQDQITSLVGAQAKNLDLVNGKLDEEYRKLKNISDYESGRAKQKAEASLKEAELAIKYAGLFKKDPIEVAFENEYKIGSESDWYELLPQGKSFLDYGIALENGIEGDVYRPNTYDRAYLRNIFHNAEEFAEQYEAVYAAYNDTAKFVDLENKKSVSIWNTLGDFLSDYSDLYNTYAAAKDTIEEINKIEEEVPGQGGSGAKGVYVELKNINKIIEDVQPGFDAIAKSLQEVAENGTVSADALKELFENEDGLAKIGLKLYDVNDAENSLLRRTADGYVLCEEALTKYVEAKIAEYTIEETFDTFASQQNAIQNLKNLKAVLDILSLSYLGTADAGNNAKDSLEKQKDVLKDQLDRYKDLIDLRKKLLESYKDELDYQRELEKKQNNVARLQQQYAVSQLDTSAAGRARSRSIAEELKEAQTELDDFTLEHAIDVITNDLDDQYAEYERFINGKIENIQSSIDALGTKESANAQNIAIAIQNLSTMIESAITAIYNDSSPAEVIMPSFVEGAKPKRIHIYHDGGIVGDKKLGTNETFAKLLNGEYVSTPAQMKKFMNSTLPSMQSSIQGAGNTFHSPLVEINCDNVTSESVPKLKEVVNEAVDEIKRLFDEGVGRTGFKGKMRTLTI